MNEIITTIAAYKSAAESSINLPFSNFTNSNDIGQFMLDTLKQTAGTEKVKEAFGEICEKTSKEVNDKMKDVLKNETSKFPSSIDIETTQSIEIDTDNSSFSDFKTDIDSDEGSLIYEENPNDGYISKKKIKQAIENPNVDIDCTTSTILYNDITRKIYVKPKTKKKSNEWISEMIGSLIVIDPLTFYAKLMDVMTGSVSASQSNKTIDEIAMNLKKRKVVDKILKDDKNIRLTENELAEIDQQAKNIKEGNLPIDLGCGVFNLSLTIEETKEFVTNIKDLDDPNEISASLLGVYRKKQPNASTTGDDGWFTLLLNAILIVLIDAIISSPQVVMIISMYNRLKEIKENIVEKFDELEFLYENYNMVKCLSLSMQEYIFLMLFEKIKSEITLIVKGVTNTIINERIKAFTLIFKSLVNI